MKERARTNWYGSFLLILEMKIYLNIFCISLGLHYLCTLKYNEMRTKQIFKTIERRAALLLLFMMLTATTAWADSITYIDENGQTQTVDATQFPSDRRLFSNTWYYVSGTVGDQYNPLYLYDENGTHNIILCDGATLTVSGVEQWTSKFARLRVYGQSGGTGKLNVGNSSRSSAIFNCDLTVNGGEVNLTAYSHGSNKSVIFNGGKLTATGGSYGILGNTTINATSGWIKASKYGGSVTIAEGKYMKDETGRCYKGTLTDTEKTAAAGKTLQPATLADYNNYVFSQDVSGDGSQNNPYVISTTAGWDAFCDRLAADDGKTFFTGKTVKLGNDISVTRMAGSSDHEFSGTFDGGHKTLTFTATAADNYVAPFNSAQGTSTAHAVVKDLNVVTTINANDYRHMAGLVAVTTGYIDISGCNATVSITSTVGTQNPSDLYPAGLVSQAALLNGNGSITLSHCSVSGTITTDGKYAAGLIGITQCEAAVSDCRSSVTINSSTAIADNHDGSHGGLIAVTKSGTVTIEGCVFNGKLLSSNGTNSCGGFVGWRNTGLVISNSLFDPAEVTVSNEGSATFSRNNGDTNNCYYTYLLNDGTHYTPQYVESSSVWRNGKAAHSVTAGEYVTSCTVSPVGSSTATYTVSGIAAYSNGITRGDNFYYGNQDQVSLTLAHQDRESDGYEFDDYTASAGTLAGNETDGYTLTMPDEDVTVSANYFCIKPTNLTVVCNDDYTATATWEGYSDTYNIDINGTVTSNVSSPYTFNLERATDYTVKVQGDCGDNVTSDWSDSFSFTTKAVLEYKGMTWDGEFVPGETLTLTAKFKNTALYEATNAVATMTSTSDYVTISNSPITVGTIAGGQVVSSQFNVTIADNCPKSEHIPVTFTLTADDDLSVQGTETLKNSCDVVFNLIDSYGDGWNGANLIVSFDDGTPSQSLTIDTGTSATYPLEIANGTHVTLTWSSGNYDGECSFTVSYGGDAVIFSQTSRPSAGVLYEFDCDCAAVTRTYTITATSSNTEQGTVSGGGEFGYGQSCTVTATPAEGYMLTNWTMNGEIVSALVSYTFTVTSDMDLVANFDEGYMIGGGDATNRGLPTYNYSKYSLSEQIYTSEELGGEGVITSIAFYNGGAEKTRTLDFYMKSTDKSSFTVNSDWIAVSAGDKVFSGSVTFAADAWTFITFSNPFIYDGTSNVVLVTDDNSSAYTNSPHMACRVFNAPSQALYVSSDGTNYSPVSPSSYNGTVLSVKNQLLFTKEAISTEPVNITVSVSLPQAGTVSGGGEYAFGDICTVSVTPNEGYFFTGWKVNGVLVSNDLEYSFAVTSDRDLVATFVHGLEIGEFTAYNTYLPSHSFYNYSLTQQIYTADEIKAAAGVINWIAFYNEGSEKTRTYDLYLKATEKTSFSSEADWVTVAETDKVFSGSVTMSKDKWTIINFTTPFEYDGTSNLVLVVDDNSAAYGNSPHMACSVFSTNENQAIYIYNDHTNFDPMSPPEASTNNEMLSMKNHILLGLAQMGDVNDNGQIDIGDAVCIVNYLVNKTNTVFNAAVANLNGNEGIDIGDAVMIVNILVGKTNSPADAPLMTTEEGLQATDNHEPQ